MGRDKAKMDNKNVKKGYLLLEDVDVYVSNYEIVVTGMPDEDDENHNCDHMGCTSVSHVLFRSPINTPIRRV